MTATSTIPTNKEQLTLLLPLPRARVRMAEDDAHAADAEWARLRWAREAAAIDAEDILTQADEALSLG